jgi:hypothetical protein
MRLLIPLAAAASIVAVAVPTAASAATRPTANISLARSEITAGATARLSYATAGIPARSAVYLQERQLGSGNGWTTAERLRSVGAFSDPGAPAGSYQFRILVTHHGHKVVASRAASLVVEPAGGSSSGSLWSLLGSAIEWLLWGLVAS